MDPRDIDRPTEQPTKRPAGLPYTRLCHNYMYIDRCVHTLYIYIVCVLLLRIMYEYCLRVNCTNRHVYSYSACPFSLFSVCLCLSLSVSLSLCLSVSVCLCLYLSLCVSLSRLLYLYIQLSSPHLFLVILSNPFCFPSNFLNFSMTTCVLEVLLRTYMYVFLCIMPIEHRVIILFVYLSICHCLSSLVSGHACSVGGIPHHLSVPM